MLSFFLHLASSLLGIILYWLPTIIARKKQNFLVIFLLNLIVGWTLIGWVAALVWACTEDGSDQDYGC